MRIFCFDVVRFIAVLLIILAHVESRLFRYSWPYEFDYFVYSVKLQSFYRLGVPLFIMISGALVLNKNINASKTYNGSVLYRNSRYYSLLKKTFHFIILALFYTFITNIIGYCFIGAQDWTLYSNNTLNLFDSVRYSLLHNCILFGQDINYASHMWFMFCIINLYVFSPFIAKLLSILTDKEILLFIFLCLIFNFLPKTLEFFTVDGIKHNASIFSLLFCDFSGIYLCYFISGYLIFKSYRTRVLFYLKDNLNVSQCNIKRALFFIIIFLFSFLLHNFLIVKFPIWADASTGYGSLFVYFNSIFLLLVLTETSYLFFYIRNLIIIVSRLSFGIYLIHYLVLLLLLYFVLKFDSFVTESSFIFIFLLCFLLTFIFSFLYSFFCSKFGIFRYFVTT